MSILIKGIEMPKGNDSIALFIYPDGVVVPGEMFGPLGRYTATPVSPHGRLIDADALVQLFKEKAAEHGGIGGIMVALAAACVDAAPTIIPAEPLEEQA